MNRKVYKRISYEDRKKIEELARSGTDVMTIASNIGVHYNTIRRELIRGGNPYSAETAQMGIGMKH